MAAFPHTRPWPVKKALSLSRSSELTFILAQDTKNSFLYQTLASRLHSLCKYTSATICISRSPTSREKKDGGKKEGENKEERRIGKSTGNSAYIRQRPAPASPCDLSRLDLTRLSAQDRDTRVMKVSTRLHTAAVWPESLGVLFPFVIFLGRRCRSAITR